MRDLQFIILLAGKGTRNYPHSKGLPHKALLPLGDKKVIDYVVQPLVEAGATELTFVISNKENQIHFDRCFEKEIDVEEKFKKKNDHVRHTLLTNCYTPDHVKIKYVIQDEPKGVGHAIAIAAQENKDVFVVYPDNILVSKTTHPYQRIINEYKKTNRGNISITQSVENPSQWGIIENGIYLEKPNETSSNQAIVSGIILDRNVIKHLKEGVEQIKKGQTPAGMHGNEYIHTHALNLEAQNNPNKLIRIVPLEKDDLHLDCGTIEAYKKSLIYTFLFDSTFQKDNRAWTIQLLKNLSSS